MISIGYEISAMLTGPCDFSNFWRSFSGILIFFTRNAELGSAQRQARSIRPVARRVFAGISRLELDLDARRFANLASETGRFAIRVVFETLCRVGAQKTPFRLCSRTQCLLSRWRYADIFRLNVQRYSSNKKENKLFSRSRLFFQAHLLSQTALFWIFHFPNFLFYFFHSTEDQSTEGTRGNASLTCWRGLQQAVPSAGKRYIM